MLPPVLEIYVVWHPRDEGGSVIADEVLAHLQGAAFSGIIGGGVQVSIRSVGWERVEGPPQPCYTARSPGPNGLQPARFVAFVPVLGNGLAESVETEATGWRHYIEGIMAEKGALPDNVGVFPYLLDAASIDGTALGALLGNLFRLAPDAKLFEGDTLEGVRQRDLAIGLTQLLTPGPAQQLTVFVSHTKRGGADEGLDVEDLIELVRNAILKTRLRQFFDASDLQPGSDWDAALRENAGKSALLAVRTDLYASREWCQREVCIAKCSGMPVLTLDALGHGEERGSFLMDHMPRLPLRKEDGAWRPADVMRALNLLTDECLKRALWLRQEELAQAEPDLNVAWWAPHAPEPLTLLNWMERESAVLGSTGGGEALRILHPDPPLGPEEKNVLTRLARIGSLDRELDIMTPRLLAARGG